jgi:ABC-type Fe3+-hydroxamate transport system substrate-binding protein
LCLAKSENSPTLLKAGGSFMILRNKTELKESIEKVREIGANTASTAEWLAEFVATTIRAESRHFANLAVTAATERLIGFRQPGPHAVNRDNALDPLAGVAVGSDGQPLMKDPLAL